MATALKSPTASGPTFWEIEERLMALADTEDLVDPAHTLPRCSSARGGCATQRGRN